MKCLNPIPLNVNVKKDKTLPSLPTDEREDYDMRFFDPIGYKILELNYKPASILAPCGKCYACRQNRVKEWTLRLIHEYSTNFADKQMYFITLTYDNENIGSPGLEYRDFQLFMKRLRKFYNGDKIKYMVVGEYGFKSYRKHYHAIIFGMSKVNDNDIHNLWSKGFVNIKKADFKACHYLLKYSFKQHFINTKDYLKLGLTPPFFRVSQGFGKSFLLKYNKDIVEKPYFEFQKVKYGLPRYYRRFLYLCGVYDGWQFLEENKIATQDYIIDIYKKAGVYLGENAEDFNNIIDYKLFKRRCKKYLENLNYSMYGKFITNFKEAI